MSLVKGIKGANAEHFCLWCLCSKTEITDFRRHWKTSRCQQQQTACLHPSARESYGYQSHDLMPFISYENMLPDDLHLRMRITNKLLNQVVVWSIDQGNTAALQNEMKRLKISFSFTEEQGDDGKGSIKKWTQLQGDHLQTVLKHLRIVNILDRGPRCVRNLHLLPKDFLRRSLEGKTGSSYSKSSKAELVMILRRLLSKEEQRHLSASNPNKRHRIVPPDVSPATSDEETEAAPRGRQQEFMRPDIIQELWEDFDRLMESLKAYPPPSPDRFHREAKAWAEKFRQNTSNEDVIPYIHAMVYHVPEALARFGFLPFLGISQVERKNYDQHLVYFQGTSKQGGKKKKQVTTQIMERENRLLFYRMFPAGETRTEGEEGRESASLAEEEGGETGLEDADIREAEEAGSEGTEEEDGEMDEESGTDDKGDVEVEEEEEEEHRRESDEETSTDEEDAN